PGFPKRAGFVLPRSLNEEGSRDRLFGQRGHVFPLSVRIPGVVGLLLAGVATAAAQDMPVTPLVLGRPVERRIAPGEREAYELRVEADQFLRVILELRGTDMRLALEEPPPGTKTDRQTPTGPYGTVEVFGLSAVAGRARLVARALEQGVAG